MPDVAAKADLSDTLDQVVAHLTTYVVFASQHQTRAIALWLAYTHAIKPDTAPPFDVVPYLLVTSPERQSGKSTLKDVMRFVAARQQTTDGITPAALIRRLKNRPTLFIDEVDTIFKTDRDGSGTDNETTRAILNSGFSVNGQFQKVNMARETVLDFPTFGPKALFGIGQVVPETVTSRSIRVRLQRKERGQAVAQRARLKRITAEGLVLFERLRDAMVSITLDEIPEDQFDPRLSDRAVDLWEPLYAVAASARGPWPTWVREAAIDLATGDSEEDDESIGEMLLRDIRTVLDAHGNGAILLTDLVGRPEDLHPYNGHDGSGLCALEERPWATFRGGGTKPITPRKVATLLKGYGIRPERMRVNGQQGNAFHRAQFEGAFRRYLIDKDEARAEREAGGQAQSAPLGGSGPNL